MIGGVAGVAIALSQDLDGPPLDDAVLNLVGWGIGLSVSLVYYIGLEALAGRTLGKLVMGTRVVSADGGIPSFGQILGRSFSRFIPFEPFSFFGKETVGWHDSLPGTRVVQTRPARK